LFGKFVLQYPKQQRELRTCLAFANQIWSGDLVPLDQVVLHIAKQIAGIAAGEKFVLHLNKVLTINLFV
jgi:hypothetical protein